MKTSLKGEVAIVMDGTGGIGTAICRQPVGSGTQVAINYRNEAKAEKWKADGRSAGDEFETLSTDVTDFDACARFVASVEKTLGAVDILVNIASTTSDTTQRKMTEEQWNAVLNTELDCVFNRSRQVIGSMNCCPEEAGFITVADFVANGDQHMM